VTPAPTLPEIVYDAELRIRSANAAARALVGADRLRPGTPRAALRPEGLADDPLPGGALPCSGFLTLPQGGGAYAVHHRRRGTGYAVTFQPLEHLFDFATQILNPLVVTDPRGTPVHLNPAAEETLELPETALVGCPVMTLGRLLGMGPAAMDGLLRGALTGRGVCDELRFSTAAGHARHLWLRGSPWRFRGHVCGALWLAAEAPSTERRDPELVSAVWYRLSATYQHELRNPLQTIEAAVEVARLRDDGRNARLFDLMLQNARLMSDFLAEELRPGAAGPPPLARLSHIVDDEIARAGIRHATKGLRFHHRVPAEEPPVRVRRGAMSRVFANLFRNAAQAAPDVTVSVDYRSEGDILVCTVADDGPGFPAEILRPQWFERRELQSHLGLAIVAATLEAHGGNVQFGNGRHGGARVVLRLPLRPEALVASSHAHAAERLRAWVGAGSRVAGDGKA
jgi:signal transduction histidine kinase